VSFKGQLSATFEKISAWTIDEICLISRAGERPFVVKHVVKLSGKPKQVVIEADTGLPKFDATDVPFNDGRRKPLYANAVHEPPPPFPYDPVKFLPKISKSVKKWITNPNHKKKSTENGRGICKSYSTILPC